MLITEAFHKKVHKFGIEKNPNQNFVLFFISSQETAVFLISHQTTAVLLMLPTTVYFYPNNCTSFLHGRLFSISTQKKCSISP